jgi:hypothetical protein
MSVIQEHPKARLADHVRACVVGEQMIFLDLLRGKYIGVGGPQLPELSSALLGQTSSDHQTASPSNSGLLDEWIRRLRSKQLLSDAPLDGMPEQPMLLEPDASLDTEDEQFVGSDLRALPLLWRSTWVVSAWLRRCSLAEIAARVAGLRARNTNNGRAQGADLMRTAVAAYMRLRPLALTSHDRCLNDSLTLVHFLASQKLFPQWVIGVHTHPFCAHSWVQSGSVVLNDLPERVRAYQPILIV